jgi:hypothetical protein
MKQDNSRNTSPGPKTPRITFSAGDNVELESRPVRKVMSKEKRKEITETFLKEDNEDFDFDAVTDKKVASHTYNNNNNNNNNNHNSHRKI